MVEQNDTELVTVRHFDKWLADFDQRVLSSSVKKRPTFAEKQKSIIIQKPVFRIVNWSSSSTVFVPNPPTPPKPKRRRTNTKLFVSPLQLSPLKESVSISDGEQHQNDIIQNEDKIDGNDDHEKDDFGNNDFGNDDFGNDDFGNDDFGNDDFGNDNFSKDDFGDCDEDSDDSQETDISQENDDENYEWKENHKKKKFVDDDDSPPTSPLIITSKKRKRKLDVNSSGDEQSETDTIDLSGEHIFTVPPKRSKYEPSSNSSDLSSSDFPNCSLQSLIPEELEGMQHPRVGGRRVQRYPNSPTDDIDMELDDDIDMELDEETMFD